MELHTEKIGNVPLVTPLVKRIDAFSSTSFKGSIGDLIIGGEKLLLLKMNSLEFIDSSALGALISVLKTAASKFAEVIFICHTAASATIIAKRAFGSKCLPLGGINNMLTIYVDD